jgi:hypothetical protein
MTDTTVEDVEIRIEKPSRKDRFQRSLVARAHRRMVKAIQSIRESRREREEEQLYLKHVQLMKDQKKKVRKTKNSG